MLPEDETDLTLDLEPHEDIIERTAPGEDALWLWAQTCPLEDCPCRAVLVVAAGDRARLDAHIPIVRDAWESSEDAAAFRAAIPSDAVVFELDIDSGDVTMPMDEDAPLSPEVERIVQRVDGDLLDRFASQWYLGKGAPDAASTAVEPAAIRDFQVGQLLAWDEVYEGARMDIFHADGVPVEAIDTYCVRPKCECNDVHVQFYEVPISDDDESDDPGASAADGAATTDDAESHADEHVFVGTVSVKLEEPVQIAFQPDQGQAGRLERLFALYQSRYPNWVARLSDRADRMASFGEKLHAHLEQKRRKPWVSSSRKRNAGKRH